jgi:hypothetical protein
LIEKRGNDLMQFAYAEWENRKTYDNMVRRRRRFGDAQCP